MGRKNEIRIIAGDLKGRKLFFPKVAGLRPTPALVRETLFNWLRDEVEGASVLDLFAGSGALGFEAASRGAKRVAEVESHPRVVTALLENRKILAAEQVEVICCDGLRYLKRADPWPFDLVFLDPPFGQGLVGVCCELLEQRGWLAPAAKIYVEAESRLVPPVPSNWKELRSKRVGEVSGHLYLREQ
jgi:16S rRNA (guanine966-N2)-methyltransferase